MTGYELQILHWLESLHNSITDPLMIFITRLGDSGFIWILLAVILLITKKYRKCGITMALALILSLIFCNGVMKNLVMRDRPFWIDNSFQILVELPTDYSFPSGHTSASFAAAFALFLWKRREGIAAFVLAALISFSRLYLCVHFPSDVLVSLVLGSIYGIAAYFIIKYFRQRFEKFNRFLGSSKVEGREKKF